MIQELQEIETQLRQITEKVNRLKRQEENKTLYDTMAGKPLSKNDDGITLTLKDIDAYIRTQILSGFWSP